MKSIRALITVLLLAAGNLAQAECAAFQSSKPSHHLVDNGDATVTDLATGLMWQQCSLGQNREAVCDGEVTSLTWQQALQAAADLNAQGGLAGHSDWRLPNVKELRSLVDEACFEPAINPDHFPNTASVQYWTSTPNAYIVDCTWRVSFDTGTADFFYRDTLHAVRLVRTAQ